MGPPARSALGALQPPARFTGLVGGQGGRATALRLGEDGLTWAWWEFQMQIDQLQSLQSPAASSSVSLPAYPNRVSFRLFRSRMRAKAAAVTRAVSTPRTTGTQDVRLWGGPCWPVGDRGSGMS